MRVWVIEWSAVGRGSSVHGVATDANRGEMIESAMAHARLCYGGSAPWEPVTNVFDVDSNGRRVRESGWWRSDGLSVRARPFEIDAP